jgi:excisionase family DNA binding protein
MLCSLHTLHSMQEMQERSEAPAGGASLLTAQQVQERLHVDASTIYRMAADGRLPAVKVGRQWRFHADAVQALLVGGGVPVRSGPDPSEPTVQAVLDVAASLLGVMMVATDMSGRPVSEIANPCPWFTEHAGDEATVAACTAEWQAFADDLDFTPRFRSGTLGFECARSYIRHGSELVGMVLAGGVAPDAEDAAAGLYRLDGAHRQAVLDALPTICAVLSRTVTQVPQPTSTRRSA